MKKNYRILLILLFIPALVSAENSIINKEDSNIRFFLESELGATAVQFHTITIGEPGTASTFDFVNEGGQELLFKFERFNLGLVAADRHRVSFLYQPLEIVTESVFKEDRTIDGVTFTAGTPMEVSYGFPFYRITYAYDFFPSQKVDLAAGAALQLRNASIVFKQLDGTRMTVSQNLGPVPALNLYGRYQFDSGFYLLTDITGLYASSAIINGANFAFEGSILDASLRAGYSLKNSIDLFFNARFLGGSASGTSGYARKEWTNSTSPTTANYLATTSVSFGLTVR